MKKFVNLPFGGEIVEQETTTRWDIVTVHFEGQKEQYRAVGFDSANVIISERTFTKKSDAQTFIDKQ